MTTPHPNHEQVSIRCAIITVSDTRSFDSDRSGKLIREMLAQAGHQVEAYTIVKDEPAEIEAGLKQLSDRPLDAVIINGGTGIAPRDTTFDALSRLLEKSLPGFGELFRTLSYEEIGSRAIASRAVAGVYKSKLVFSLPGSSNAVKLALQKLILPELIHLVSQLKK